MDNKDEKLVKTKTLDEFDQSTPYCALKEDPPRLDLTNSTSMGAHISKSQENGSGVLEEERAPANSIDGGSGGGGGGEDESVPEELSMKNVGVEEALDVGSVADDGEIEKENKEIKFGEKKDGIPNGKIGSGDKSSSIAQRTRNRAKKEDIEDMNVDAGQRGSEIVDEVNEENTFSVGDFVWGKIKSHPWWPGRIYDPSDASEFSLKYKHEGRLLVAYFGDRTFAWCDPSQLKSFEENFEEMSKQSSLKTFVNAVMEAVNEFGRLVKLQMTCSCARAIESQSYLPFVVNGGVKEGVCVPENGIAVFSADQFNSSALLADIRRLATFDSVPNTLEVIVLKSRSSAFYHAKFGYSLPMYVEPMSIEDPLDKGGVPKEASFRVPGDGFFGPEDKTFVQNGLLTPLDVSQKGRKTKSIAELLAIDTLDELEGNKDRRGGEKPLAKSVVKSSKKRQRVSDEDKSSMREVMEVDSVAKDEEQSRKLVAKSGRRKRKTIDENESHVLTRSSTRRKEEGSARSTRSEKTASGERRSTRSEKTASGERRSTRSEKTASGETEDGSKRKKQQKTDTVTKVTKKSMSLSINGSPMVEEGYGRVSPRERKLSKYLSPPYTIQLQRQRSSCSENGSDQAGGGLVFSDVAKMGERMAKTAGKLVGSPPLVKCSAQTFQKASNASGSNGEKTDHPPSSEVDGPTKSVGSLNGVLREVRSAARDPLHSKRDQSFDSIKGFLSSYRNSNYKNGPNYNSYKKKRAGNLSGSKPKPIKRSATKREPKLESKAEHEVSSCGPSSSSAALLITFPEGFSLPKKKDIIKMCCKFGDLDESETEVVAESSMAKIVFVRSSCAEAAMDSLRKSVPFGSTKVKYKIQSPAAGPGSKGKKAGVQNKKKMKSPETKGGAKLPDNKPPAASPESEPLAVIFIKQKLESMTSMLAQTDGKMSQEIKSNLENEVKELLKKVKMMTAAAAAAASSS